MKNEINIPNLSNKQKRRLVYLISTFNRFIYSLPNINDWDEKIYGKQKVENLKEIHRLFNIASYSEEERNIFFHKHRWVRREDTADYNAKPIKEKKDNKDFYNGGGGSNKNKVRYPKKCRKTAWKRFAKLFPNLVKVKKGKIVKK